MVGSSGSKLYCLLGQTMQTIDAPLSAVLEASLNIPDFEKAYQVCFCDLLHTANTPVLPQHTAEDSTDNILSCTQTLLHCPGARP